MVARDGTIDVTEKIDAHFIGGPWHGLYRSIPDRVRHPAGLELFAVPRREKVTDGDGHRLKYDSSRVRHYRKLKIYVPDADDSVQTISIEYTISDAIKFFEDHDELYWNVTGDEWDVPIQSAHAQHSFCRQAPAIFAPPPLPACMARAPKTRTLISPATASRCKPLLRFPTTQA